METNVQIELSGKYLPPATKPDDPGQLSVPIYSTRKSSRRLNQIQLNSDYVLDGANPPNNLASLKDLKDSVPTVNEASKKEPPPNGSASEPPANPPNANNSPAATKQQRKW